MGRLFLVELVGHIYCCTLCSTALALGTDLLSRSFTSQHGRAFLFNKVVNVFMGPPEDRAMLSGMHTVEDVFCVCCSQNLGWRYVTAHDKSQKYKEGKFVLERVRISEDVTDEVNLDSQSGSSDQDSA